MKLSRKVDVEHALYVERRPARFVMGRLDEPTPGFPPTVVPEAGEAYRLRTGGLTGLMICLGIFAAIGDGDRRLRNRLASGRRLGFVVGCPEGATCQAPPDVMMVITGEGTGPGPWVPPRRPLGLRAKDPLRIYSATVGLREALPPIIHGVSGGPTRTGSPPHNASWGLNRMRGFRGGHSPPFSPRIVALFLPEPTEKELAFFVFLAFVAAEPPTLRALAARSHGQRLPLEKVLIAEGLVAGSLAQQRGLRRPHRGAPPSPAAAPSLPGASANPRRRDRSHTCRGRGHGLQRALLPGLPASAFFSEWLRFFGLQPHHLAPNAILQLSAFVFLCEGFVGIEPRVDLWRSLFFFKQQSIAMEKSEVEKLAGPRPMTPCGAALVHHHSKSGFPQMSLQESIKQWQRGFFYVKSTDPAQDALNMPPFNIDPSMKLNWAAKTPKPIPEVALICAHLKILEKSGLLGRDLLTTMVTRRMLPLQRQPHLVYQMSGRHDPCRLSTKRFTPSAVARRVNLISTAHMDDSGNWSWGMTPFNGSRPPPMMFEKLQGSLCPLAPGVDVSDASEIEDEGVIKSRSDSSAGSENALESEGTELSGEYPRPSVADWTDDDETPSFLSDAAFEEDSDGVEEVTSPPLTHGRRQRVGATVADETAGKKGNGATASRPAPKRPAPGAPAGARAHGAKKRRGAGRRQVPMVAGSSMMLRRRLIMSYELSTRRPKARSPGSRSGWAKLPWSGTPCEALAIGSRSNWLFSRRRKKELEAASRVELEQLRSKLQEKDASHFADVERLASAHLKEMKLKDAALREKEETLVQKQAQLAKALESAASLQEEVACLTQASKVREREVLESAHETDGAFHHLFPETQGAVDTAIEVSREERRAAGRR
ncbi:hypothetical protein D1007_35518 [Hordeum vulgare]|nr:hypothetical protein D1007_35518 [Hordeum vulgare]